MKQLASAEAYMKNQMEKEIDNLMGLINQQTSIRNQMITSCKKVIDGLGDKIKPEDREFLEKSIKDAQEGKINLIDFINTINQKQWD